MSMVTYPLNNIEYTAEDAELFHSTRTSGVYATNSFDFSVTGADNTVLIGNGIAWIKNTEFSGKVVAQKESVSLDLGIPDSYYPRIDAIVIQFDANKNATDIVVKKGTASSNPVAPAVVRTESVYELHLYHIRRDAGSLAISSNVITDLRSNENYCGLMSDSVTQAVDTTLSKRGVAADAAAVGEALSKVAGYGLGDTFGRELKETDLDDVYLATGWYRVTSFDHVALREMDECACGLVRVEHLYNEWEDEEFVVQTLYLDCQGYDLEVRRVYGNFSSSQGRTWSEWEYVNPQMVANVEYRTTQVWEGKPVYRKLANLGSVSNGATVVWHNESNIIPLKYDSHFYAQTVPKYENASAFFFVNVVANKAIISSAGFTAQPVSITVDYVYTRG